LKIDQHLAKSETKIEWFHFFRTWCIVTSFIKKILLAATRATIHRWLSKRRGSRKQRRSVIRASRTATTFNECYLLTLIKCQILYCNFLCFILSPPTAIAVRQSVNKEICYVMCLLGGRDAHLFREGET